MLCCCWSPKGGSGTTVVAASLGLELAAFGWSVVLVDLGGDLPALLGVEASQEGLGDWLGTPEELPADALRRRIQHELGWPARAPAVREKVRVRPR